MKSAITFLLVISTIIVACKSKDKFTVKDENGGKATVDLSDIAKNADAMKDRSEALQKLPPLSLDELKAALPEQIMGANRDNMEATKMAGLANYSKADYRMNDSTEVEITIFDCAGTEGAGYYNMAFLGVMSFESDNENEYTKTTEFKGDKAIETCKKKSNHCEFTFFGIDRYMVTLKGDNVGIDKLKQIGGDLNLK
jgi:hypothetical protein